MSGRTTVAGERNPAVADCECGIGSGCGFEGDGVSERGELTDVVTDPSLSMDLAGVVVDSEVVEAGGGVSE